MPFTVQRWPGSAVLVVTGHGAGSLDESERVLEELARQQLVPVLHGVLFDLRQLEWIPNPEEARLIAARYGTFGARHGCRMAYLAPPGAQYGVARMIEMLSQQYGVRAATFATLEAAHAWLLSEVRAMGA
ncbi:MAG TPA: hypothetical protein PKA50_03840 [Gemmatimonadales bacterium]|nr:hypothetical protein [Gemmatimonadales bacterium]